ncbi:MAG: HD domain-containing protein [Gemmatimonadota bacterium]|nr:HD domain-containing protein [Gemmatimonadota bacterium]
MTLYADGHPARTKAIDSAFEHLRSLQSTDAHPQFSFLGYDVVYGNIALRELKEWDWGARLANAGIQRLEFGYDVTRDDFEYFLDECLARLTLQFIDSATRNQERKTSIKFGAIGVRGAEGVMRPDELLPTATIAYSLQEEADTIRWLHDEVEVRGELPLLEAESVVKSLSVAMHGDKEIIIPLLQLKEFDQYTTTHSLNVSVLAMALSEYMGMGPKDVRGFGVAGLLHDLGKVRIPKEVLTKPGKLTDDEWAIMRRHPVDGAKIIYESDRQLDLASAVAYEHHIMINGGGYPHRHFQRDCHKASKLVHICDVYDALRTNRPYREAWEADRILAQIEKGIGWDFEEDIARAFIQMMGQWERRVAVVDDKTPLPQYTEAAAAAAASAPAPGEAAPSGGAANGPSTGSTESSPVPSP